MAGPLRPPNNVYMPYTNGWLEVAPNPGRRPAVVHLGRMEKPKAPSLCVGYRLLVDGWLVLAAGPRYRRWPRANLASTAARTRSETYSRAADSADRQRNLTKVDSSLSASEPCKPADDRGRRNGGLPPGDVPVGRCCRDHVTGS